MIVTHCKLADGTKIWYLSTVEHADHADIVLADVQMGLVQFRSSDLVMGSCYADGNVHSL